MEAETLILPDNTVIDTSQPPPGFGLPKPDFSEVILEEPAEPPVPDKTEGPLTKPTFKSALQAKKRLQAFSSARTGSLPSSPSAKKVKPNTGLEEKNEESKKAFKKATYHDDKAKAVIEEIEELKREEQAFWEAQRHTHTHTLKRSRSRSKSRSADRGRFKKVDKKSRNYRRRSVTPEKEKPKKVHKKSKKYPKNWREFVEFDSNFTLNQEFEVATPTGNNELLRQTFFESPSLPINPFKMKTVNREDKVVPFEYVRYTRSKPVISYSVNCTAIKEAFLPRKLILESLPKDIVANMENLYKNSLKFKMESNHKKPRNWFPRVWQDSDEQCKVLEKSVGLSFLQTYTGEEEEADPVEEIFPEPKQSEPVKKKPANEEKKEPANDEKKEALNEEKNDPANDEKTVKIQKEEAKKKKKGKHEVPVEKKKKRKHNKEKKKRSEENIDESTSKKKKHKKDKKKKEKRLKEKKVKNKKVSKEKKNKEKAHDDEEKPVEKEKVEKPSKQQVMEELKVIEEKLAKKREQERIQNEKKVEKEEKDEKSKGRKRKNSEREEHVKRAKHDKHRKPSEHKEVKIEKKEKPLEDEKKEKDKKTLEEKKDKKSHDKPVKKTEKFENHSGGKKNKFAVDDPFEEELKKHDHKKESKHYKKSRWSDIIPEIKQEIEDLTSKLLKKNEDVLKQEEPKMATPDTEEYHSHWESDDEVSSSVPRHSLKMNRSWESDEELFGRGHNVKKTHSPTYANLEIPLNITSFSRRAKWEEKPNLYINEIKLLEEERRSLSEERKKLELEKQKILQLQEEVKLDLEEKKIVPPVEEPKVVVRLRSSTPEAHPVKVKKEKSDIIDFNVDSLNNSLLSNVSSTESNFPIAVLENEYEEFMKAVSTDNQVKKKSDSSRKSSSSSSSSSDSDHKKKKRKKKKKKKKKLRETRANIFDEFDIPVPSELPEMVPTPVPVPSPIETILPLNPSALLLNSIIDIKDPITVEEEPKSDPGLNLTKPFVFPSIVLPNKRTALVDNSSLNLNDDSDSADFTDKFVKKPEEKEVEQPEAKLEEEKKPEDEQEPIKVQQLPVEEKKLEEKETKIEELEIIQLPPNPVEEPKKPPSLREEAPPEPKPQEKPKRSRSTSPYRRSGEKPKEKRRSRSRSRSRRRSPIRRRGSTPPRRRYSSPRRRTPPRRRSSPRRRSPSPRHRLSPPRRRRRSPSLSPLRSRGGTRKRTPSPRIRRASPLNSPLDGFKRSVADSTISDDMLPQPTPEDYVESPPLHGVKYHDRKGGRRGSLSPQPSPKRISLDDRINQVLGLEKNEQNKQLAATYPNYYPHAYGPQQYGQYPQYGQYGGQKTDYVQPFAPPVYTQPPPPIAKPVPTPTKVVQVGNILQVVPNEEITHSMVENRPVETTQKIVQVGNMLQIVPATMTASKPPAPEPLPVQPPPSLPEKQSAEAIMKQKNAERKAEREKRRLERERRRKEKERKRKEKEKRRQMKLKIKTENMIKRAIQLEAEALASEDLEEEPETAEVPVQWPPVPAVVGASTPCGKGILLAQGSNRKRKSVQFADGVRPGEGTSPSGGEELSSPPPHPTTKLPKEKRYKKLKIPKKSKKKKIKVKVVKKVQNLEEDDDDEDDNLPPPSPPPGSPPPHVFPSRVKTHTINNVHPYVSNIIQSAAPGFTFRPPMPPMVLNRHQPPPGYMTSTYHSDVGISHQQYQGVPSHH